MVDGGIAAHISDQDQVDALKVWWKKYGSFAVTVIALCILAISGWHYWQYRQLKNQTEAALQLQIVLNTAAQNNAKETIAAAQSVVKNFSGSSNASIASLFLAQEAVKNGEAQNAIAILKKVVKSEKTTAIKELAVIRLARLYIADKKPQLALKFLKNSSKSDSFAVFFNMIKGDAYLAVKDKKLAKEFYSKALKEAKAYPAMEALVQMKLSNINS